MLKYIEVYATYTGYRHQSGLGASGPGRAADASAWLLPLVYMSVSVIYIYIERDVLCMYIYICIVIIFVGDVYVWVDRICAQR